MTIWFQIKQVYLKPKLTRSTWSTQNYLYVFTRLFNLFDIFVLFFCFVLLFWFFFWEVFFFPKGKEHEVGWSRRCGASGQSWGRRKDMVKIYCMKKIKNCKSLNTALNYETLILKIIKATRISVTLLKDISYKITRLLFSLMKLQKKIENISKINCMKVEKFQNHQALITF